MGDRLDVDCRGAGLREPLLPGHPQVPPQPEDPALGSGALIIASWIDKGLGLLIGGFSPTPYETYEVYTPTFWEVSIGLGIFAVGALVVSILWKIAIDMKREGGEPFELAD